MAEESSIQLKHKYLADAEVITAALERLITGDDGFAVTNLDFALHLFYCAKDMLPFEDALNLYGYTKKDFEKATVKIFKSCYNVGVSHTKRDLTAKLAAGNIENRPTTLDSLQRVYNLYADPKDDSDEDKTYEFLIRQKDKKNLRGMVK